MSTTGPVTTPWMGSPHLSLHRSSVLSIELDQLGFDPVQVIEDWAVAVARKLALVVGAGLQQAVVSPLLQRALTDLQTLSALLGASPGSEIGHGQYKRFSPAHYNPDFELCRMDRALKDLLWPY